SAAIFLMITPLVKRDISLTVRVVVTIALAIPGIFLLLTGEIGQQAFESYVDRDYEAFGAVFRLALLTLSGAFYLAVLRKKWKIEFPEDYHLVTLGAICMIG